MAENFGLGMPVGVSIVSSGVKGKLLIFFLSAVSATGFCAAAVYDCVVSVIAPCFCSGKIRTLGTLDLYCLRIPLYRAMMVSYSCIFLSTGMVSSFKMAFISKSMLVRERISNDLLMFFSTTAVART